LDLALGRTNVIHAALAAGGPTTAFLSRCRRLASYRGETGDATALELEEAQDGPGDDKQSPADAESNNVTQLGRDDPGSDIG